MNNLYIVATPIGNLGDITLRALETLKAVDVIACEDTRHTQIILTKFDIHNKRLIACHAKNEMASSQGIIKLLEEGQNVAYVSDAGTPGISDPGNRLVREVRNAGFTIVPIPGVSAMATLVSASGTSDKAFTFEGFLSPKSGKRRTKITALLDQKNAFILYESPYRIEKLLHELEELCPEKMLTIGREMTKTFEEFITGTPSQCIEQLKVFKGEFCVLVSNPPKTKRDSDDNT